MNDYTNTTSTTPLSSSQFNSFTNSKTQDVDLGLQFQRLHLIIPQLFKEFHVAALASIRSHVQQLENHITSKFYNVFPSSELQKEQNLDNSASSSSSLSLVDDTETFENEKGNGDDFSPNLNQEEFTSSTQFKKRKYKSYDETQEQIQQILIEIVCLPILQIDEDPKPSTEFTLQLLSILSSQYFPNAPEAKQMIETLIIPLLTESPSVFSSRVQLQKKLHILKKYVNCYFASLIPLLHEKVLSILSPLLPRFSKRVRLWALRAFYYPAAKESKDPRKQRTAQNTLNQYEIEIFTQPFFKYRHPKYFTTESDQSSISPLKIQSQFSIGSLNTKSLIQNLSRYNSNNNNNIFRSESMCFRASLINLLLKRVENVMCYARLKLTGNQIRRVFQNQDSREQFIRHIQKTVVILLKRIFYITKGSNSKFLQNIVSKSKNLTPTMKSKIMNSIDDNGKMGPIILSMNESQTIVERLKRIFESPCIIHGYLKYSSSSSSSSSFSSSLSNLHNISFKNFKEAESKYFMHCNKYTYQTRILSLRILSFVTPCLSPPKLQYHLELFSLPFIEKILSIFQQTFKSLNSEKIKNSNSNHIVRQLFWMQNLICAMIQSLAQSSYINVMSCSHLSNGFTWSNFLNRVGSIIKSTLQFDHMKEENGGYVTYGFMWRQIHSTALLTWIQLCRCIYIDINAFHRQIHILNEEKQRWENLAQQMDTTETNDNNNEINHENNKKEESILDKLSTIIKGEHSSLSEEKQQQNQFTSEKQESSNRTPIPIPIEEIPLVSKCMKLLESLESLNALNDENSTLDSRRQFLSSMNMTGTETREERISLLYGSKSLSGMGWFPPEEEDLKQQKHILLKKLNFTMEFILNLSQQLMKHEYIHVHQTDSNHSQPKEFTPFYDLLQTSINGVVWLLRLSKSEKKHFNSFNDSNFSAPNQKDFNEPITFFECLDNNNKLLLMRICRYQSDNENSTE